jgi:ribokinase
VSDHVLSEKPKVSVVGSFNMDLVFSAPRLPEPGETLSGTEFGQFIGGKGSNQAVAAARAGAQVEMVGRLGKDTFGDHIATILQEEGIRLRHVVRDAEEGTGVAGIVVQPGGTNSIVVIPRANGRLSARDVQKGRSAIAGADVLLLQLEVPVEASLAAAKIAKASGATVVLNPAPAQDLPDELLRLVDILVPNVTEAAQLSGIHVSGPDDPEKAARALLSRGSGTVVLTLGERGALIVGSASEAAVEVPPFKVEVIDTTAAGDAFCGALAVALAEGKPLREAAQFASAAGALACTSMGAGPSLPARHEIERLLTDT